MSNPQVSNATRPATRWRYRRGVWGTVLTHATLAAFGVGIAVPLLWIFVTSLKTDGQYIMDPMGWLPTPPTLANYGAVLDLPVVRWAANTTLVVGLAVVGQILSSACVGFSLAYLRFQGRDYVLLLSLLTLMLNPAALLIPQFLLFNTMGWVDTYLPLVVPSYFALSGVFVFYFRQYFRSIPKDLIDAVLVDGGSYLSAFRHVVIPLSVPAIVTVGVLGAIFTYNDFLMPFIYLRSEENFTLALGFTELDVRFGAGRFSIPVATAGAVLFVLPLIATYVLLNKKVTEGVERTSGLR